MALNTQPQASMASQPGPFNGSCQAGPDPAVIRRPGWATAAGTSQEHLSPLLRGNHRSSVASIYQADVICLNCCQVFLFLEFPQITTFPGGKGAFPSPGRDAICTQVRTKPLAPRCAILPLLLSSNVYSGQQCLQLKDCHAQLSLGPEETM